MINLIKMGSRALATWALCSFWLTSQTDAQDFSCGTHATKEQMEYLQQNLEARESFDPSMMRTGYIYVPVKIHVVNRTNGTGGITQTRVNEYMQDMQNRLISSLLFFYECSATEFINSDTYFDFDSSEEPALSAAYDVPGVVNIYFIGGSLTDGPFSVGGYTHFPPGDARIFVKTSLGASSKVLSHEMGHVFSLYHTHGKSNYGTTDELVNGSNCAYAGDDVCDTPADPGTGSGAPATDANGQAFAPDTYNLMSYYSTASSFSARQRTRMLYSALVDRNYLNCATPTDCATPVEVYPYNTSWETGLSGWTQSTADDFNWSHHSGNTPSPGTGPSSAQSGTFYYYIECDGAGSNKKATLISPCFSLLGVVKPQLQFYYHMQGSGIGTLLVDVSTDGGYLWEALPGIAGNQGTNWLLYSQDLSAYAAQGGVKVRISATTTTSTAGDIAIDNFTILSQPCSGSTPSVSKTDNFCYPGGSGSASITMTGGASPWTYSWSTGNSTSSISGLQSGTYRCTVTDVNTCATVVPVIIENTTALITAVTTPETDFTSADGAVNLSATAGLPPFSYSWSTGATTQDITGLSSGVYTVTVSDQSGCPQVVSYGVGYASRCYGTTMTLPYIESFETGMGGWYDNKADDDFDAIRLNGPTPTAGTGPDFAYHGSWYLYAEASAPNSNGKEMILESPCINLSGTTRPQFGYSLHKIGTQMGMVRVMASADGVEETQIGISQLGTQTLGWKTGMGDLPAVFIGKSNFKMKFYFQTNNGELGDMGIDAVKVQDCGHTSISVTGTNETCYKNDGTASVTVTGSNPPYTYVWSNGATTPSISNLAPNIYYNVTVTSADGCTYTGTRYNNSNGDLLINTFPYAESFETGMGSWYQSTADNFDWTRTNQPTPTKSTGPDAAAAGSYYIFANAASPNNPAKTSILTSAAFDLRGKTAATFTYKYHQYGNQMGTLSLQVSTDCGTNWTTLWSNNTNLGNVWNTRSQSLNTYLGQVVMLRFVALTGAGARSDMGLDDVSLTVSTTKSLADAGEIPSGLSRLEVFPNPSSGEFNLRFTASAEAPATVELYNLSGQLIFSKIMPVTTGENVLSPGKVEVPTGLYLVKLIQGDLFQSSMLQLYRE